MKVYEGAWFNIYGNYEIQWFVQSQFKRLPAFKEQSVGTNYQFMYIAFSPDLRESLIQATVCRQPSDPLNRGFTVCSKKCLHMPFAAFGNFKLIYM